MKIFPAWSGTLYWLSLDLQLLWEPHYHPTIIRSPDTASALGHSEAYLIQTSHVKRHYMNIAHGTLNC